MLHRQSIIYFFRLGKIALFFVYLRECFAYQPVILEASLRGLLGVEKFSFCR